MVAQQILSILTALSQKVVRFVFEGSEIKLVHTCGIFITMNPGYAGRTELPDNLKSMFRPISMMVPDSSMIAEINLFCEGFEGTRILARKVFPSSHAFHPRIEITSIFFFSFFQVFTLYTLAQQQLSKQYHYDFGLRGIVTLTRYAGKKKRLYPNLPDEEVKSIIRSQNFAILYQILARLNFVDLEMTNPFFFEVIILAMNDMNIAKLTSDDLPLFLGITSDLFPEIEVPTVDYEEIISYITKEAIKLKLQVISSIIFRGLQEINILIDLKHRCNVGHEN